MTAFGALATPLFLGAQGAASDTVVARQLAPGVAYREIADRRGPWRLYLVRVDLRRGDVALRHVRALDSLRGRERPTAMVRRVSASGTTVLAGVNADFFDLATGENENEQVIGGEWWKGLAVTDSPYDTFDNVHAQLAVDAAGRPTIDRFALNAHLWARGTMLPILTVNARPVGTYEGTTLYTARYGAATPSDTARTATGPRDVDAPNVNRPVAEAPMVRAGARGDTLLFVRRGAVATTAGTPIPPDGAVLAAYGPRATAVRTMADGDTVRIRLATRPALASAQGTPATLIGGWPRIVHDGANVAGDAALVEGTISNNAEARHPRTAVGYSRDGRTLYLLVVDGRSERSVGMTLVELADAMRRLGAWQALNFDGGGSTAMIVGGVVANVPSDAGGERTVGNALLVVRTR